jgi:ribonuclease J
MAYKLRFIPLGGIVGVTKNMYVYELYKDDQLKDILIVDCGIGFPKVQEFGVDFEIPDITYLEDKVDKIRGLMLTHGHEDHISAVRFHYNKLGRPRIYTTKLTSLFVQNKAKEQGVKLDVELIDLRRTYMLGGFDVKFIRMTHSIPDTTQLLIKTPAGTIYHGSDYKIDLTPPFGWGPDFFEIAKAGREGVLCLLSDCLGSDRPGFTDSESVVGKTFEDEIRTTKGKFIMTTFASNISRVRQCAEAAVKFNRKVCLLGRSLVTNTDLVKDLGYFPIAESSLVKERDLKKYKPYQLCLIATGSQGQYGSAMARIAMGEHKYVQVEKGDKVVFSSDPIPGNEEQVYELIEHLYKMEADVRYSGVHEALHASGHGSQGDMLLMMKMVGAKYLIPIGGTVLFQRHYRDLARRMNYEDSNVFLLEEGQTVEFADGKARMGKRVLTKNVYVDAYGVGDVGEVILRDRQTLATEGFVFIVVKVDSQNKLIERPECTSRGFVYGKGKGADREKIFDGAGEVIQKMFSEANGQVPLHRDMITKLERYFEKQTNKQPLVVVEVLRV